MCRSLEYFSPFSFSSLSFFWITYTSKFIFWSFDIMKFSWSKDWNRNFFLPSFESSREKLLLNTCVYTKLHTCIIYHIIYMIFVSKKSPSGVEWLKNKNLVLCLDQDFSELLSFWVGCPCCAGLFSVHFRVWQHPWPPFTSCQ